MFRPRTHIWIILILLIAALAAGFMLMGRIDPFLASARELLLVYLLLFAAIFSLTSLLGYFFRIVFWKSGVRFEFLRSARRQGVLFGLLTVTILLLEAQDIFSIWTGLLLIVAFSLFELYLPAH